MDIRLLSQVAAFHAGRRLELGPRRQRFVFAVLALEVNRAVSVERLVELTWPITIPRTAAHAIQVNISGLRSAFTRAGVDPDEAEIRTEGNAYVLRADPTVVDAHRFHAGLRRAAAATDDQERVALLTEALDLWSGPPLSAAGPEEARQRLSVGLEEARLTALEDRIDARLRLGDHHAVLGELATLTQTHPHRERLIALQMLALYRSAQASQSLAVYRQIRDHLAEEFGIDPGPRLQEMELAILRNDPALAPPDPDVPRSPASRHRQARPDDEKPGPERDDLGSALDVPDPNTRELPPDVYAFVGRHRELAELDQILNTADGRPGAAICVVSGSGGVGKTALVVHWAHRIACWFPDGQLFVDLRGFVAGAGVMEPVVSIRGFLDALGVPVDRIPATTHAQTGMFRSLLAGKRMLIMLDNARDEEQVRPLLPGSAGCLVVVTSRSQLTGLIAGGARPVVLNELAGTEARELLVGRLGAGRVAAEPDAVEEIVARCAQLPLALAVTAARAAIRPTFPLATLAADLRAAAGSLDAFESGDPATDLRAVFASSYVGVSEPARRLFRLLGLHPGPDFAAPAAASLAALDIREARRRLAELTRAYLLTEHAPGRFTCHDLLRAFAAEQADVLDDDGTRHAAVHRLLDHLLHAACQATLVLDAHRDPIIVAAPLSGVVAADEPDDHEQALAWFTAEHRVLLAAMSHASVRGFDRHAWQLGWALSTYLHRQGHWYDQTTAQRAAVSAARRSGDRHGQAHALRNLALADARLGRLDDANTHNCEALDLFGQTGDRTAQAHTYLALAWASEQQGRNTDALRYSQQALDLYQSENHRVGQARALNDLAWSQAQLGNFRDAIRTCRHALAIHHELGDLEGEASTWDSLGYAHLHTGDQAQAITCYRRALDQRRRLGDRYGAAETLTHLGEVYAGVGDAACARKTWLDAMMILNELGHPDADVVRAKIDHVASVAAD